MDRFPARARGGRLMAAPVPSDTRVDRYLAKLELAENLRGEIDKRPDTAEDDLARALLRKLKAEQKEIVLLCWLEDEIAHRRRDQARAIERQAQRQAEAAETCAQSEADRERRQREEAERQARWLRYPFTAPRNTRIYKQWAQTKEGQKYLAEEAEKGRRDAERKAYIAEHGLWAYVKETIWDPYTAQVKKEARLELTKELLESTFALGDGRHVSWGQATMHDHVQRIELLMRNAAGSVVTAKLHEEAIRLIQEADAGCLNELVEGRAA